MTTMTVGDPDVMTVKIAINAKSADPGMMKKRAQRESAVEAPVEMDQSEIPEGYVEIGREAQHRDVREVEAGAVRCVADEIVRSHRGPADALEAVPAALELIDMFLVLQIGDLAMIETGAESVIATGTESESESEIGTAIEIGIGTEIGTGTGIEIETETEIETESESVIAIATVSVSVIEIATATANVTATENENQTETGTFVAMLGRNPSASARNTIPLILTAIYHLLVTGLVKSTMLHDTEPKSRLIETAREGAETGIWMSESVTDQQIVVERGIESMTIAIAAGREVAKESEMPHAAEAGARAQCLTREWLIITGATSTS